MAAQNSWTISTHADGIKDIADFTNQQINYYIIADI
jgi:hypothetical protein